MITMLSQCTTCHEERLFEQPPCVEGHDDSCPEWVCSGCGYAILMGADAPAPARAFETVAA